MSSLLTTETPSISRTVLDLSNCNSGDVVLLVTDYNVWTVQIVNKPRHKDGARVYGVCIARTSTLSTGPRTEAKQNIEPGYVGISRRIKKGRRVKLTGCDIGSSIGRVRRVIVNGREI